MTWSGDAGMAATRAEEAGKPYDVVYVIPQEGAEMFLDMMAIPKDAPHIENAHVLIDFLLRPEIMARITNYVTYPNAVPASMPMIDREIAENPMIYPPAGDQGEAVRSHPAPDADPTHPNQALGEGADRPLSAA